MDLCIIQICICLICFVSFTIQFTIRSREKNYCATNFVKASHRKAQPTETSSRRRRTESLVTLLPFQDWIIPAGDQKFIILRRFFSIQDVFVDRKRWTKEERTRSVCQRGRRAEEAVQTEAVTTWGTLQISRLSFPAPWRSGFRCEAYGKICNNRYRSIPKWPVSFVWICGESRF